MRPQDYSTPELEKQIEFLNQKYYGEGLSVVPDCEYDALTAELRSRNPDSPLLCSLGDDAQQGAKTLSIPAAFSPLIRFMKGMALFLS